MSVNIVVDLGFGDSGKGIMTDYLANKLSRVNGDDSRNPLVIRFNGGHQAGHTVCMADGRRHVFSNFGSGTFRGAPTYWSNHCTIDPLAIIKEYDALKQLNTDPILYIDALCPVTTFFDMIYNQYQEEMRGDGRHGSCGVGFGATVERNLTTYKLHAQDLKSCLITNIKLKSIHKYYSGKHFLFQKLNDFKDKYDQFINCLEKFNEIVQIVNEKDFLPAFNRYGRDFIFEGAQGILLDQDFGFFPHVTRSNTTSKNAIELIDKYQLNSGKFTHKWSPNIYYVTRAYQTRHGAGPMTNEDIPLILKENSLETNKLNSWQEHFRKAPMDLDLLRYAIDCDNNFNVGCNKNLVITCMDQIEGENIICTSHGEVKSINKEAIGKYILDNARASYYHSNSPVSENIKEIKYEDVAE